jgi:hypothetical protein
MDKLDRSVGLCASCRHCRIVPAKRSTFYQCTRAFTDARFRKYPPLPVVACIGYDTGTPVRSPAPAKSPDCDPGDSV